ncbi:MAG TPA: hypothetical protein VGM90_28915 [Kofleriaceae bacterium]|jgi:hypothetical protein
MLLLALLAGNAAADDDADPAGSAISGTLRMGYWTASRALDDRENLGTLALWTRATPRLGRTASLVFDGWVGYPDVSSGDRTVGSVREAFADLVLGSFEARLGKRIIVWGRADAVNPTDNLTPRDYTLLVSDDADQRVGAYCAELAWHHGSWTVTSIWLPGFQPSVVPLPATLAVQEQAPRWVDSEQQAAFKLERSGERIDWSLSYFDGYDRIPDLAGSGSGILLEHHRTRVIGADAATVVGRYQVRSEMAVSITDDWAGKSADVPTPGWFGIVGADRTFGNYLNVNAQYLVRVAIHHRDPFAIGPANEQLAIENAVIRNQLDTVQHGATVRISDKWWNETLEGELLGVILAPHASYAVRGKVSYAFSDRWRGIIGFDYYNGSDPSFFRNLRDTSTVFAELRLGL